MKCYKKISQASVLILALLILTLPTLAQTTYTLSWWTPNSGLHHAQTNGAAFTLSSTIGQTDAGLPVNDGGGQYTLNSGFWAGETGVTNLVSLQAVVIEGEKVQITWEAGMEMNYLGFNLYRASIAAGPYTKLNEELIPVLTGTMGTMGAIYSYIDVNVSKDETYYYRLEAIDHEGAITQHGPVSVTVTDINSVYLPLVVR